MNSEFSIMIKEKRQQEYPTARKFFLSNSINCTYQYYSRIEQGLSPDFDLAVQLLETLSLDLRKGLLAWVRDKLPKATQKALFSEIDEKKSSRNTDHVSVSESLVINRMQAKLLETDPCLWELLTYISINQERGNVSKKTIATNFKIPSDDLDKYLRSLYEHGLIDKLSSESVTTKDWLFIPYEEEFSSIRDTNFKRALEQFFKQPPLDRYRTTITCLMNPEIKSIFEAKVVALTNDIINLAQKLESDESNKKLKKETVPYTIGVFSSKRQFGN
ncbi:MAG: hypothetical protein R3C42_10015 [Parvularculaceae bacterium]